jgi:hypothetical protein
LIGAARWRYLRRVGVLALAGGLACPAAALAQTQTGDSPFTGGLAQAGSTVPPARRRAPQAPARKGVGYRLYFATDFTAMLAADTFAAVTGSSTVTAFGGSAEVLRLWRGLFLRGGATYAAPAGERVVVFNNSVVPVGIPLEIRMMPIEAAAGWRIETGRTRAVGTYVGAGLLRLGYRETSAFATTGDEVDKSFTGYLALVGVDLTMGKRFVVGVEGQYRGVPNAIGQSGVAHAYGETNLGGITARVLIGIRK